MLCKAFNCTPNDMMDWLPDKPEEKNESNPLTALFRDSGSSIDLTNFAFGLPYDALPEFAKKVDEFKKEILAKGSTKA